MKPEDNLSNKSVQMFKCYKVQICTLRCKHGRPHEHQLSCTVKCVEWPYKDTKDQKKGK